MADLQFGKVVVNRDAAIFEEATKPFLLIQHVPRGFRQRRSRTNTRIAGDRFAPLDDLFEYRRGARSSRFQPRVTRRRDQLSFDRENVVDQANANDSLRIAGHGIEELSPSMAKAAE